MRVLCFVARLPKAKEQRAATGACWTARYELYRQLSLFRPSLSYLELTPCEDSLLIEVSIILLPLRWGER